MDHDPHKTTAEETVSPVSPEMEMSSLRLSTDEWNRQHGQHGQYGVAAGGQDVSDSQSRYQHSWLEDEGSNQPRWGASEAHLVGQQVMNHNSESKGLARLVHWPRRPRQLRGGIERPGEILLNVFSFLLVGLLVVYIICLLAYNNSEVRDAQTASRFLGEISDLVRHRRPPVGPLSMCRGRRTDKTRAQP
jgi:hypothetical protein